MSPANYYLEVTTQPQDVDRGEKNHSILWSDADFGMTEHRKTSIPQASLPNLPQNAVGQPLSKHYREGLSSYIWKSYWQAGAHERLADIYRIS
jgi:hypothetical protein